MTVTEKPVLTIYGPGRTMEDYMQFWWLAYIEGFDITRHCQNCFIGTYGQPDRKVRVSMPLNESFVLDESPAYRHLYLCGVSYTGWADNFHLAMEPVFGERAIWPGCNGFAVEVLNAKRLDIPPVPDGYGGYPRSFTTCRNWQFGVRYYTDHRLPVEAVDLSRDFRSAGVSRKKFKNLMEKAAAHKVTKLEEGKFQVTSAGTGWRLIVTHKAHDGDTIRACTCKFGSYRAPTEDCRCSHTMAVDLFLEEEDAPFRLESA